MRCSVAAATIALLGQTHRVPTMHGPTDWRQHNSNQYDYNPTGLLLLVGLSLPPSLQTLPRVLKVERYIAVTLIESSIFNRSYPRFNSI